MADLRIISALAIAPLVSACSDGPVEPQPSPMSEQQSGAEETPAPGSEDTEAQPTEPAPNESQPDRPEPAEPPNEDKVYCENGCDPLCPGVSSEECLHGCYEAFGVARATGCRAELLKMFDCHVGAGCEFDAHEALCESESSAFNDCYAAFVEGFEGGEAEP